MSEEYTPTVEDIGELLRARTKDANGNEVGTFTEDTRPTDDAVEAIIEQAVSAVAASANGDVPTRLEPLAQHCAALRAAMIVELTYWPEQTTREVSAYAQYQALYDSSIQTLRTALSDSADSRGLGPQCITIRSPHESE